MKSAAQVTADIAEFLKTEPTKAQLMCLIAEDMVGWPYAWGATGQKCTVSNREARMKNPKISDGDIKLIKKRCQVLNGSYPNCNGCKYFPGGETVNMYDCIGFVNCLLNYAGVDHYGAGCSIMWNHAANWSQKGKLSAMPETVCLLFQQQGSTQNKMDHIGLYCGNDVVIHCSGEVKKQKLADYPWTHFAIPKDLGGDVPVTHTTIRRGDTGPEVAECQLDLIALGYDVGPAGADGKFGAKTETAVKAFQTASGLKADGIVGKATWAALDEVVGPEPGPEPPKQLYTVIVPHLTEEQANALQEQYPDAEKRKEG